MGDCLGTGKKEKWWELIKHMEAFRSDGYIHYFHYDDGFMGVCILKFIKLHTLNICSLFYVSYALIKMLIKETKFILE